MKRLSLLAVLGLSWLLGCRSLQAQFLPASSNAVFYFAHLADGGPPNERWTTVFRLVNPVTLVNLPVAGTLWFFDPQGNPLALDFGHGPVTSLQVSIPAQGAIQLETAGTSPVLRTGWCWAFFDSPVLAVEEFRLWDNGVFSIGASVNGSGFTYAFETYADRYTGVAVANPTTATLYCSGELLDTNGNKIGENSFALPGLGQVSFVLGTVLNVASLAPGSYNLSCHWQANAPPGSQLAPFAALTIAGNSYQITSSLPPGDYALPSNPYRMIWNAFYQLKKALNNTAGFGVGEPNLQISGEQIINATFTPATNTVTINLALAELFADSPSEVAWVIAHELGHAHQSLTGILQFDPTNKELDADQFALFGQLLTGYDAYAAGGALGKLMMALQRTGLVAQNFDNLNDPHTSFTNRMGLIMSEIQTVCGLPEAASLCQAEHNTFHPHMPPSTPLLRSR